MENELPKAAPSGSSQTNSSVVATLQTSPGTYEQKADDTWLSKRAYGFNVAGCNFFVEQGLYTELLTGFKISSLPNTPDHFLGLTNVRGNLVPVYQLEPLFGNKPIAKAVFALLFDHPARGAAIVIEEKPYPVDLKTVVAVNSKSALERLPAFLRPAISKTYDDQKDVWYQVQHSQLFKYMAQFI